MSRARRPERPTRPGAATYDHQTATWFVPLPDAWLNLHSGDWSGPVQFRAVPEADAEGWRIRIRDASTAQVFNVSAIERDELLRLLHASSERGSINATWALDKIVRWIEARDRDARRRVERV